MAGFIESWGRGIEKICSSCKEDGLPIPEFTINPGDIMVKFTAPADRVVHGPAGVTDRVTDNVTVVERKILDALLTDPGYSYMALAEKLLLSRKTVEEHIKRLKEKGIIDSFSTTTDIHLIVSTHVETECLLSELNVGHHIEVEVDLDEMDLMETVKKAMYEEIKIYVKE